MTEKKRSRELLESDKEERQSPFIVLQDTPPPILAQRKTERVDPSPLLARVRQFLPTIASANEDLKKRMAKEGADVVNIEAVDESDPHVDFDLFLAKEDSSDSENSEENEDKEENEEKKAPKPPRIQELPEKPTEKK